MLAYVQLRKLRTVATGDLTSPLGLTPLQERELFRRMARGGLIARVRPGLYLVPSQLPLGGSWSPGEIQALNTLMADRKGKYQICGPNAFNRYGFDSQIPTRIYAYNNKISGLRTIGAVELTLIKVGIQRLGETETFLTGGDEEAVYSSHLRTLVDAVYDWSRFNGLPRAYAWIRNELMVDRIDVEQLIRITLRYGNVSTIRRIGALLEREVVDEALLLRLEKVLRPTSALIPWIPTQQKRGTVNRRWGVVYND